jgi:UPF0755 protein
MIGAIVRLFFLLVALALCAAAALFVYSLLGNGPSLSALSPANLDAPMSDTPSREKLTIRPGESATEVGNELQERSIIRSALAFRWEVESRGIGNKLEAGEYEVSPSMSTREIVAVLGRGAARPGTAITVIEGWRTEQIADRAEQLHLGRADEIVRLARAPREAGLQPPDPSASTLEGYLFPDTYQLDPNVSSLDLVNAMLKQFNRRVDDGLRQGAATRGLTIAQAVTLASIVEREAAVESERPLVASVYLNRLQAGMRLEADPTVQYALAARDPPAARGYGYWKRDLSLQDLQVESPFNTYRVSGLPPGPICSPGLASLQAVVNPAATKYFYFVARGDGTHAFAETHDAHLKNVQQYR